MEKSIRLTDAFRIRADSRIAIVGAGGKTTLLFNLARDFSGPVIVATTTHLSIEQASQADHHIILGDEKNIKDFLDSQVEGITLLTGGPVNGFRLSGLSLATLSSIEQFSRFKNIPIFIEADGSRGLPLKAPAAHEPPIPEWVDQVIVVAGLSGVGQPIDESHVHRPDLFAAVGKTTPGEFVTIDILARILVDQNGGMKNIPARARRSVLLNQADDEVLISLAGRLAEKILLHFDSVVISKLQDPKTPVKTVFQRVAGIVLAAGKSSRMGRRSKVLISWRGESFVHRVAREAIEAGLSPVIVVTGSNSRSVKQAVADLPVICVKNPSWKDGQSTSLQRGIKECPENIGAAIFLLADQPQVTHRIILALKEEYFKSLAPIIAPMIADRRANPVLFDHCTFERMMTLTGDSGGRALFSQFPIHSLTWHDELLLLDVDTPQNFHELKDAYEERYASNPE